MRRGPRIAREGKMAARLVPEGVEDCRYRKPTRAAKRDWTVLRKTGNLKSSGLVGGP